LRAELHADLAMARVPSGLAPYWGRVETRWGGSRCASSPPPGRARAARTPDALPGRCGCTGHKAGEGRVPAGYPTLPDR